MCDHIFILLLLNKNNLNSGADEARKKIVPDISFGDEEDDDEDILEEDEVSDIGELEWESKYVC